MRGTLATFLTILTLALAIPISAADAELTLEHEAGVVSAAWNADESLILTASQDGRARVFDAADGALQLSIDHAGAPLTHAFWAEADAAILSADESGGIKLSAAADGAEMAQWQIGDRVAQLSLNAARDMALAFTEAGGGSLLSLEDGALLASLEMTGAIVGSGFSADGSKARAWNEAGEVSVWDTATGEPIAEYRLPHRAMLRGLEWSQDDSLLLGWFADGAVSVYESDGLSVGGRAIRSVRHRSFAQRAIFSRDETLVMSWAADDTAHIWRISDGASQALLRHEDWVIGALWDAEENRVLSWAHIFVYVWDGERPAHQFRHGNLVRGAAWNRDSTRVLSWSWDGTARVWQAS